MCYVEVEVAVAVVVEYGDSGEVVGDGCVFAERVLGDVGEGNDIVSRSPDEAGLPEAAGAYGGITALSFDKLRAS